MVNRLLSLSVFAFTLQFSQAQSTIDVLHYKFEIALSDSSDSVKGNTFVTLNFTRPSDRFWLNLASVNSKGQGMSVYRVTENDDDLDFSQRMDTLTIQLKNHASAGEKRTFQISYKGIPSDGLIISKNRYGERTFFADNWPNRAHDWIPCKDEPDDKASFEFVVTAPSGYSVVSNGKLEEQKTLPSNMTLTHWTEDVSLPTKIMVIGVARFAIKEFADGPPHIAISAWTYPRDSVVGFRRYSVAAPIVKFFSEYIGPYPYNKLANVQSTTMFGGMENASAIFYDEESAEGPRSFEDVIAHEIAHQWFGDMASEKSFPHLWLSEGFATYFENMYVGMKYGEDSMKKRLLNDREQVINFAKRSSRPVVDSVSPLMGLLNANSYMKGGWILYMMKIEMGDSLFQKFIRTYYDRFKGSNADTDDLERIAEEVSNKDWRQFFKQWLYTPGIPQLDLRWQYDEKNKTVSITVTQLQKQQPFQFPLQVGLRGSNLKVVTLNISKQSETFSVPSNPVVTNIEADPNTLLLFESRVEKINP